MIAEVIREWTVLEDMSEVTSEMSSGMGKKKQITTVSKAILESLEDTKELT